MPFDRKTMVIAEGTRFEEYVIVTKGDVIVGDGSTVEFGIKTDDRIFVGERARIKGSLDSRGDVRVDSFSNIEGDVTSKGSVYLGERVVIHRKLSVRGDLDVGDDVEIKEGFEAKGWINIRSPIPIVIYIFIYLLQLLKLGRSEEIEKILKELEEGESTIPITDNFTFIPNNSFLGIQNSEAPSRLIIGNDCKVMGNFNVGEDIRVGKNSIIHGSLSSKKDVLIEDEVEIKGGISASGNVYVGENSKIHGDIMAEKVFLPQSSRVDGTIIARRGLTFGRIDKEVAEEKLKRFNAGVDVVDEVEKILE